MEPHEIVKHRRSLAIIEARRAEAEISFSETLAVSKTSEDHREALLDFVFTVFVHSAYQIFNLGLDLKWSVTKIRELIENQMEYLIDETFDIKSIHKEDAWAKTAFTRIATNDIRDSDEWRNLLEKLRELATWQAHDECEQSPEETPFTADPTSGVASKPTFPNRSAWLADRLRERGWGKADPLAYGGPDRKTVGKIIRSESVRPDVLERLAEALSKKFSKINVTEIPQD